MIKKCRICFTILCALTFLSVCAASADATPLTPDVPAEAVIAEAGETALFSFTPAESGLYTFISSGDNDTYGYLYDASMNVIASEDGGGDGSNFMITCRLEAGAEYYFGARYFSDFDTGSFSVTLSKEPSSFSWSLGDGVLATLESGVLTISGAGPIPDYFYMSAPWYGKPMDTLVIESGITAIGNYAFLNCGGFTGNLSIPDGVTSIGFSAFEGCSGFTGTLTIPDSVTNVGSYAFQYCSGFMGNLTIPNSVTYIGNGAFYGCSGLTGALTIPDSVMSIGADTFVRSGFTDINTDPGNAVYTSINGILYNKQKTELIACPGGKTGTLTIPDSVTSIGNYAFCGCSGFTGNLTIPDSMTSIGDSAFCDCSGFTGTLTIPNSVTSIGDYAFAYCSGFTGNLTIPDSVTGIGDFAFYGCSGFTGSLTIPDSVTGIGSSAFYGCSGFTGNLTIPDSVAGIGDYAFYECSNLTKAEILNGDALFGNDCFGSCPNLVLFGYTGSTAQEYAAGSGIPFYPLLGAAELLLDVPAEAVIAEAGETALFSFTPAESGLYTFISSGDNDTYGYVYDASMNAIASNDDGGDGSNFMVSCRLEAGAEYYFGAIFLSSNTGCFSVILSKENSSFSWKLGDGVLAALENGVLTISGAGPIPDYSYDSPAPWYGKTMDTLVIESGITAIGDYIFFDCGGFTGNLSIPDSVTSIGNYAFFSCSGFTGNLIIPNSVTSIGYDAFRGCRGFTGNLTIPDSVTSIGDSAFWSCSGFTGNLTIPDSVTSIGNGAFVGSGFTDINTDPGNEVYTSIDGILYNKQKTVLIACPGGKTGNLTIPDSVTSIGDSAFWGCSGFTGTLTIPDSVTSIGDSAFCDCSGFTGTLTIPNSVTSIGDDAFSGCSGFTGTLAIPDSVTSIGNYAFYGCSGFTGTLTIPENVTTIGDYAFNKCTGFTGALTIPDSVTDIGYAAFEGCSGFTGTLTIPDSVTRIEGEAFLGCSGFTGTLTIPDSVTDIEDYAFYGCSGLTKAVILNSEASFYGSDCFYDCPSLVLYGYPGSTAQAYAADTIMPFYPLLPEKALILPASLTAIEEDAFSGTDAEAAVIPKNVVSITGDPFGGNGMRYIYGHPGTAAETFALNCGYTFVAIDDGWSAEP